MTNYFTFLSKIVENKEYDFLLKLLLRLEFYSFVPLDENRSDDGLALRDKFVEETGQHALSLCPQGPCTVLEMMIGLAYRLENESLESSWENSASSWFWVLLENLGLLMYDNTMMLEEDNYNDARDIVIKMVDRRYKPNGDGGLFPLKNTKNDQRKVEIWYQMSEYIMENYPF